MGTNRSCAIRYLALDQVAEDPQVARRLPPELAWRFHALPVAEDHGQITVAMADPDDDDARSALAAVLGPVTCVVRADPRAIDSRLARIWGNQGGRPLDLVACCFPDAVADEVWAYALAVGELLGARLSRADTQAKLEVALGERGTAEADVVLLGDAHHPSISGFVDRVAGVAQPARTPSALWVVPRPRWPLRRILLVLDGAVAGQAAVDWTVRVARPAGSSVTVLTTVPPVPAMYGRHGRMEDGLPALLTSASPLGQQMRDAAHQLVECQVEATLKLRAGPAEWQVCHELVAGDYDLVVAAVGPMHPWLRWLQGHMIRPLLRRIDRPLLLTAGNTLVEPAV